MPADDFVLRQATLADAQALSWLGERTFRDTFGPDNRREDLDAYAAKTFSFSLQHAELSDSSKTVFLAESRRGLVGYAKLVTKPPPACVASAPALGLERLYVEKAWHGLGVGPALMQTCLTEAASKGYRALWLGVWERNHRALAFYRKGGFTQVGSMAYVLGSDVQTDYVMVRAVSP